MNVGYVQFQPLRRAVAQNIDALRALLRGVKADLLVLPELSNSGYLYSTPSDLAPYAEDPAAPGPFLSALVEFAAGTGGLIVAGFAERAPRGLYNSAAAVDPSGILQVYRKMHLFADEQDLFLPGDSGFKVLPWRGVRIGMMVCFDWAFPEAARTLALRGAQIIAHPANLVLPYCQQTMVARSLENRVFSITANRHGPEDLGEKKLNFTGRSQVLDPKGNLLLQAPLEGDAVAVCAVDPLAADDKWMTPRNHLFDCRRPEFYQ